MGLVRVVLYAEGPRETSGIPISGTKADRSWGCRAPGEVIPAEEHGPGHVLIRRILVTNNRLPQNAIQFEEGLRCRGRVPRGSQLLKKSTLRQLLSWAHPDLVPQLVVVLVDRDGVRERREQLLGFVRDRSQTTQIIAVAQEEFEAWLIADESAAGAVLDDKFERTPDPESLECGKAKNTIDQWISTRPQRDRPRLRRDIAEHCDLEILRRRCGAFERLLADLAEIHF